MKCDTCRGHGWKPNGFYTIDCVRCGATGILSADQLWKERKVWSRIYNDQRLMAWRKKWIQTTKLKLQT